MKYWNKYEETMDQSQRKEIQEARLVGLIEQLYHSSPFYRTKLQERGILPGDITSIENLSKLPFVTKQDMRDNYPYGMFSVPSSQIIRLHASSGTTGHPTVVGYTKRDVGLWSEVMARSLTATGMDNNSIIQIAYGYGLFTGGLGIHYGAELMGASVIPVSSGNTTRQIMLMKDFGTTALACTPSYALYIAEEMKSLGIELTDMKLKVGIFGAEPSSEEMRRRIETSLGLSAFDIYGLSEIIGPGVACECHMQNGLHINEDHFYPEVINPVTGESLPDGEKGELVITTLTKEGMPMIRYRTRDLTILNRDKCKCGRTLVRMAKVLGRSDDMIIIRGVNVFPSQVESVLMRFGASSPYYQLVVEREGNLDKLTVMVEMTDELFSDEVRRIENMEAKIAHALAGVLSVSATVRLMAPRSIERSEGKARRVIDKRKI